MEQKTLVKMCIGLGALTVLAAWLNYVALSQTTRANVVYANHAYLKAQMEKDKSIVESVQLDVNYIKAGLIEIQERVKIRDKKIQDTLDCLCRIEGKVDDVLGKVTSR